MQYTTWNKIEIIRNKNRPTINDYIPLIFTDFFELHGDRYYGDDKAIIGGIAYLKGMPVTIISQVKGRNLEENKSVNFAMPHPEGYRKALRLAKLSQKFNRPIICFIDTPGAFCGIAAEERGQGEAIAKNLMEFFNISVPIVAVVLGEGGSGGALGIGVCDTLGVLENAIYSVISPRGFASILWKDGTKEKEAAEILKITADDLIRLSIAEKIIKEPLGGAHNNHEFTAENISDFLISEIAKLTMLSKDDLLEKRYEKFRKIGDFTE